MNDRVFFLRGDIDIDVADRVERFCRLNSGKPVMIDIDSQGGFVDDAARIYRSCRNHGKVIGFVSGNCLSAAVVALCGCAVRAGAKGSRFMLHRSWRNDDIAGKSRGCRVASHRMSIHIAHAIGKKDAEVMQWIDAPGETRFDADQAYRAGLLHCRGIQAGPRDMRPDLRLYFLSRQLSRVSSAARKREGLADVSRILRTLPRLSSVVPDRFQRGSMSRLLAIMPTGMAIG
jgi:ATP-dependent protease ClpP protease subunit